MNVIIEGKVLNIHHGKTKAEKEYTIADVYDGRDLVKIFGVDESKLVIGSDAIIPCRLDVNWDKKQIFLMAVK